MRIEIHIGDGQSDETRWLKPGSGESFHDIGSGPEMVAVPAGSFMMGSHDGEDEGDEGPLHEVTIAKPFTVGRYAVTFDEWDAVVVADGITHEPDDKGWGRDRHPVINVSWEDAMDYCVWLSKMTGKSYRLLSEAEWEYCCRAGTKTPFWWGSSISTEQANYDGNYLYGSVEEGDYRERAVPVDSFEPNPWGLYQVHGNVWEWCADNWHPNYQGAPHDGSVWQDDDTSLRVVRGGSWDFHPYNLRSAYRDGLRPVDRSLEIGFRVARTL